MIKSPLLQLTYARLLLAIREPSTIFWSFGFPVLLTLALGIAFRNRPPEPVIMAIEAGPQASTVLEQLAGHPQIRAKIMPAGQAGDALRTGKLTLVVSPGQPRTYVYDPTRPESLLARATVDNLLQRAEGRKDVTSTVDRQINEPGARYIDFLVPGLIGSNVMSISLWGIGYVIVETRTRKLLKRMIATPMKRSHFLLSFVLMRVLFAVVELPILLFFSWLVFGVVVRGSIPLLVALDLLGALAFAGIAVLLSSRARNTETVAGLINLVVMPMFVVSGVFFAHTRFPEWAQPIIRVLPLTAFIDAVRAVMNEGAGLLTVAPQVGLLAATALGTFAVGLKLFRWN